MTDLVPPAPIDPTPATPGVPAGWYPDSASGLQRWWDGTKWTENFQPAAQAAPAHTAGPLTAGSLNVNREVIYNRQQKGHSLTLWIILSLFLLVPVIGLIYYSVSPNHYWHA